MIYTRYLAAFASVCLLSGPPLARAQAVAEAPPADAVAKPAEPVAAEAPVAVAAPAPEAAGAGVSVKLDELIEKAVLEAVGEGLGKAPGVPRRMALPAGDPRAGELSVLENAEVLRRQAEMLHFRELMEEAFQSLRDELYDEAVSRFTLVVQYFDDHRRSETERERQLAHEGLSESYYRRAQQFVRTGLTQLIVQGGIGEGKPMIKEFQDGLNDAKAALALGHRKAERLVAEIQDLINNPPRAKPPPRMPVWSERSFLDKEGKVRELLQTGREHALAGQYDKALSYYEAVLKMDPSNTEAMRLREKVGIYRYDRSTMELESTRKDMMGDLRATWNPRDYRLVEEAAKKPEPTLKKQDLALSERVRILNKVKSIVIPEIDFRQANIQDVVSFLQEQSREHDRTDDVKKGVNIILNVARAAAPGVGAAPVGLGAPAPAAPGDEIPLVTFSARYISLLEALKIVTSVAQLEYRVEGNVVWVVRKDMPFGVINVRMYPVLPSFGEKVDTIRADLLIMKGPTAIGGGAAAAAVPGAAVAAGGGELDLKDFFGRMGVKWPEGSSIQYVRSIGQIVVANTDDNLTTFEWVLGKLNVVPNQIEIEARFVEVAQTDVSSLGIEWMLTDDWEVLQRTGSSSTPYSSTEKVVVRANSTTSAEFTSTGFTAGNRYLTGLSSATDTPINDKVMTVAGILTNPELTAILHAVDQSGHSDLLSAPKVTTQAGKEATIKVVTEYIYPTDFEVTPIMGTTIGGVATVVGGIVEPSSFQTREVGVILQVTPDVNPEGTMINLTMMPQVVSDPTWRDYGSTYTDAAGNTQRLPMEQPFFHTRSVATSIAIYNGATVVMGGMITERRIDVDDRIPFLGDIPLLGRLFRSKYEKSEKRNLLIFVTARLVDPAGRAVEKTPGGALQEMASPVSVGISD